ASSSGWSWSLVAITSFDSPNESSSSTSARVAEAGGVAGKWLLLLLLSNELSSLGRLRRTFFAPFPVDSSACSEDSSTPLPACWEPLLPVPFEHHFQSGCRL